MKKWISFFMICCILCGTIETAMAGIKEKKGYDMGSYYNDVYANYRSFMQDTWQEIMGNSEYVAYGQLVDKFKGGWQECIDSASGILGVNLTTEKYLEILINLVTMMRYGFEESLEHQAEIDTLKSIGDYSEDVIGILMETIGSDQKLDIYLKKDILEKAKKINNDLKIVFDGLEITITSAEQYGLYQKTLEEYQMYQGFLEAIANYTHDPALKDAAKVLLKNLSAYIRYALESISESSKKTVEFLKDDIWLGEIIPDLLKDRETLELSQEDYDCLNMIFNVYTKLKSYGKITFDLGMFAGDMLFGTTNVFIRYNEMYSMKSIRDALNKQIGKMDKKIKTGEQFEEISKVCQLLRCLVYVDCRGSYCLYAMLENDAQLLSLWNFKNYKNYEEWYEKATSIQNMQLNLLDTLIPDLEWYCENLVEQEDIQQLYKKYRELIIQREQEYGSAQIETIDQIKRLTGVNFLELLDFDGDGVNELLITYRKTQKKEEFYLENMYEIWGKKGEDIELLDSGELYSYYTQESQVILTEIDERPCLMIGFSDNGDSFEVRGVLNDRIFGTIVEGYSKISESGEFCWLINDRKVSGEEYTNYEKQLMRQGKIYNFVHNIDEIQQKIYETKIILDTYPMVVLDDGLWYEEAEERLKSICEGRLGMNNNPTEEYPDFFYSNEMVSVGINRKADVGENYIYIENLGDINVQIKNAVLGMTYKQIEELYSGFFLQRKNNQVIVEGSPERWEFSIEEGVVTEIKYSLFPTG